MQQQTIVEFENKSKLINKFLQNAVKKIDKNLEFIDKEKKSLFNLKNNSDIEV